MESVRAAVAVKRAEDGWMQTYTGRAFYPEDPNPEDVCIKDIAHHLSLMCRFGQTIDW